VAVLVILAAALVSRGANAQAQQPMAPKLIPAPVAPGTENPGTEWARNHPAVMHAYRKQYTRRDGVVNWELYDETFRRCVDRVARPPAQFIDRLVWACSLEANRARAAAQAEVWEQERRRMQGTSAGPIQLSDADRAAAVATENAEREALLEVFKASHEIAEKAWSPAVLGYELVVLAEVKSANKKNIADERKAAKYGGVVDLEALYTYQQRMREADEEAARIKGVAAEMGIRPAKASSADVEKVAECVQGGAANLSNGRTFSAEDAKTGTCFWLYALHVSWMDGETARGWMAETFDPKR
jgi:hypothetical protein